MIEKLMLIILTIALLSIPFLAYNWTQADNECKQQSGVFVKSSSGWTCIKAETPQ